MGREVHVAGKPEILIARCSEPDVHCSFCSTRINLGSFYVMPGMQRRGIGTQVLRTLLAHAADQSKAITLAVVKINPARRFYEKHGFRIIREDEQKFYMTADPRQGSPSRGIST
jgi:ribosomal protein S18 acetylase RimI-like enzyme